MTRIPWIFGFITVAVAVVPPGRDLIEGAFFSGEALTRNIARPIVMVGFGTLAIFIVLEWWLRSVLYRRRHPLTVPIVIPAQAPASPAASPKPTE
jgi:hypothetical protein